MRNSLSTSALALAGFVLTASSATSGEGEWTKKASLPVAVAEVGVTALDGKVYVIGGTEQNGSDRPIWNSTQNLEYDAARDTWRKLAPLPHGLTHVGVAALGDKIYAIGGFTNIVHMGAQDLAFVYDPRTDKWSPLPNISSPRGSVAVAAVGGKLHIFGGRGADKVVKLPTPPGAPEAFAAFGTRTTHQVYDPATGKWSDAAPLPAPPRDHVGIAVIDGKVHLFGGRTEDVVDNLDRHDVYDPATDSWTIAAPLPRPRSAGAYTVLDGRIIYAGGECKPGGKPYSPNAYDDVTAFDPKTNKWTDLASLPQARHAFGAATVGDTAYFAGGAIVCGGGASSDLFAFKF